jgi:hypothetical protein
LPSYCPHGTASVCRLSRRQYHVNTLNNRIPGRIVFRVCYGKERRKEERIMGIIILTVAIAVIITLYINKQIRKKDTLYAKWLRNYIERMDRENKGVK